MKTILAITLVMCCLMAQAQCYILQSNNIASDLINLCLFLGVVALMVIVGRQVLLLIMPLIDKLGKTAANIVYLIGALMLLAVLGGFAQQMLAKMGF